MGRLERNGQEDGYRAMTGLAIARKRSLELMVSRGAQPLRARPGTVGARASQHACRRRRDLALTPTSRAIPTEHDFGQWKPPRW